MKRAIFLVLLLSLFLSQLVFAERWQPTTPSGWPEITINAPENVVVSKFQNSLANKGLMLRSRQPGIAIFEGRRAMANWAERIQIGIVAAPINSNYDGITRITLNLIEVERQTRIILMTERVLNPGTNGEIVNSTGQLRKHYEIGMAYLQEAKQKIEADQISAVKEQK
jgi:hypothetical protein